MEGAHTLETFYVHTIFVFILNLVIKATQLDRQTVYRQTEWDHNPVLPDTKWNEHTLERLIGSQSGFFILMLAIHAARRELDNRLISSPLFSMTVGME